MRATSIYQSLWFMALISLLCASLAVSWQLQASVGYGYSFWYKVLAIDEHIDHFAPQNRYKRGFAQLSDEERIRAFDEIAHAVHSQGNGLAEIRYSANGREIQLLREPEIVHLNDVARLIDTMTLAGAALTLLGAFLTFALVRRDIRPDWRRQLAILCGVLALGLALVFLVGAKDVFYQLHVWIFPENHQWFFYYQESLMSTLMKAPDLFGGIAIAILTGGLLVFSLILLALHRIQRKP